MVDSKNYFKTTMMKCKKKIIIMMGFGLNTKIKNEFVYKEKWATIYDDCKKFETIWLEQVTMRGFGICFL